MCFSAEASFTAAALLVIAAIILIRRCSHSKMLFLALIPLFFGLQQFSEGVFWIALNNPSFSPFYRVSAHYTFLFFAEIFWPIWIPFAFVMVEKMFWRQVMMGVLLLMGLVFSLAVGYTLIVKGVEAARVVEHSIDYGSVRLFYRVLYGVITVVPFFLSSIKKMWILGCANAIAFIIAALLYSYAFISVWCAVSAIIALGFLFLKSSINEYL